MTNSIASVNFCTEIVTFHSEQGYNDSFIIHFNTPSESSQLMLTTYYPSGKEFTVCTPPLTLNSEEIGALIKKIAPLYSKWATTLNADHYFACRTKYLTHCFGIDKDLDRKMFFAALFVNGTRIIWEHNRIFVSNLRTSVETLLDDYIVCIQSLDLMGNWDPRQWFPFRILEQRLSDSLFTLEKICTRYLFSIPQNYLSDWVQEVTTKIQHIQRNLFSSKRVQEDLKELLATLKEKVVSLNPQHVVPPGILW